VKLAMDLVATMAPLVLGLLVRSGPAVWRADRDFQRANAQCFAPDREMTAMRIQSLSARDTRATTVVEAAVSAAIFS
jgi:hypothetical protein